jgi:general secretion pathway protein L
MQTENPSVVIWQDDVPVLWRAGALEAEAISDETVLPQSVVVGLPSDDVRTAVLEVSADERKHLASSLPYMMEEQVADDVDDLHFVSAPVSEENYLVAFTRKAQMTAWIEALPGSEELKRFSPEALCLPIQEGQCCIVINGDEAILRWSESQGARVDLSLLSIIIDSLAEVPSSLVIYGTDREAVMAHLSEEQSARVDWRQGGWGALLMLSQTSSPINLRQGAFAPLLPLSKWWNIWKAVAIAAGLAMTLQFVADLSQYQTLKSRNLELRSAIQDSYRKANPRGAVVDVEKQLNRQLSEFAGGDGVAAFTPRLVDVVTATLAHDGRVTSVNYSAGQLRLNLTADNFAAVERIRQQLEQSGLKATLETSNARGDEVRARLRVEVS